MGLIGAVLSGCATESRYFKLDRTLESRIRDIDGKEYVPLLETAKTYGLEYKWDTFVRAALLKKDGHLIAMRTGGRAVLLDGTEVKMANAMVLYGGQPYVSVIFIRDIIGRIAPEDAVRKTPLPEGPKRFSIKRIVIDAGHGGADPGAIGRRFRTKEKNMTLALAKKLKALLEGAGIKVILTRSDDTFIPLSRRAQIANTNAADLFVSVHMNASRSRSLRGFECYYLSEAMNDNARALEAFENSPLRLGEEASAEHSRELDRILWDMILTENRNESAALAGYICDAVEKSLAVGSRGVKSARFHVLRNTYMPAVLLEAGYISNRYEEAKLRDDKLLDRIAEAVVKGILKYKEEYEKTEGYTKS